MKRGALDQSSGHRRIQISKNRTDVLLILAVAMSTPLVLIGLETWREGEKTGSVPVYHMH